MNPVRYCPGPVALGLTVCLGLGVMAETVPPPDGGNSPRVEYRNDTKILEVTLPSWPEDGRVFLSGWTGTPTAARLQTAPGQKRRLPLVIRPEGWYIFLPPAPPCAGTNRIWLDIGREPGRETPVTLFRDSSRVLLEAGNGENPAPGEWRWRVKFPRAGDWIAMLRAAGTTPVLEIDGRSIDSGATSAEFDGRRLLGVVNLPAAGIHAVTLRGISEEQKPELQFLDIRLAAFTLHAPEAILSGNTLRLSSDGSSLCNWTDPADSAAWDVPVLLAGRYRVVGTVAAEQDSAMTLDAGSSPLDLELRGTGAWERFQQLPLGEVTLERTGPHRIVLRGKAEAWQPVNLRELNFYPVAGKDPQMAGEFPWPPQAVESAGRARFTAPVAQVLPVGEAVRVNPEKTSVTHWMNPQDYLRWRIQGAKPGQYRIRARVATMSPSHLRLSAGAGTVTCDVPATGGWGNYQELELGVLPLKRGDEVLLTLFPGDGWTPINLGDLQLELLP